VTGDVTNISMPSNGVVVPWKVSAIIRGANLGHDRSNFDSGRAVTQRMTEMNANAKDEKGHIIGKNYSLMVHKKLQLYRT